MSSIIELVKKRFSLNYLDAIHEQQARINAAIQTSNLLSGKILSNQFKSEIVLKNIHDAEFKVFSQWGDDGIIQYVVNRLDIPDKRFIEFGVSDYTESNTRFLLLNNNWSGLVLDCSEDNIKYIMNDEIYWKYDLTAKCAFITIENINEHILNAGFSGEIGLLHIDIDGNDYWVWKSISVVNPVIVIIEYNSVFGSDRAITIPYKPNFNRFEAHNSGLYAGSSLLSLCDLADEKGYYFIGSNSSGNNAYFVRKDKIADLDTLSAQDGYVSSKFREHRDETGYLTFWPGLEALKTIRGLKVFNTRDGVLEDL